MRDLTSGMQTEVQLGAITPIVFYEGDFLSGNLYFWTGIGSIDWNGHTWTGAGTLISFAQIEETANLRAVGLVISLSGISSSVISTVLGQARNGMTGKVWIGFLSAGVIVVDPYLSFSGKLDVPSIEDAGEICTVSVTYESRLIDLERARVRRWTNDDQQIEYPGDTGFRYVAGLPDKAVTWGGATVPPFWPPPIPRVVAPSPTYTAPPR